MSDGEAASGKNDSQFIHGKLKTTSARIFASILALCGALVVSIQTYVYVKIDYVDNPDSKITNMFLVTNATAMASGLLSFLSGLCCLCCVTPKRTSCTLKFNIFLQMIDAILAVAALVLATLLTVDTTKGSLLFDLQLSVAALSAADFILSATLIFIISIGVCRKQPDSTSQNNVQQVLQFEPVETIVHQLVPIPEEIIEVEPEPEPEPEQLVQPQEVEMEKELSPIEQLKLLSREELERRLQEHFQHQFLEELRSELDRRKLTQEEGIQPDLSNQKAEYDDLNSEQFF